MSETKKDAPPKGLGRGLSALIPNLSQAPVKEPSSSAAPAPRADGEAVLYVQLRDIMPNRYQPRQTWNPETLKELAASIKATGLLQPLLVRRREASERSPTQPQNFELIAGERRLRALELAGLDRAPVVVRDVDSKTSLEMAIVENIQREDLNPVDEALGYRRLIQEFHYSQEELSHKVAKDRSTVTNSLRLLNLPESIQASLAKGLISAGHARALLSLERDKDRLSLEQLIIRKGLSVREAERMVREARERGTAGKGKPAANPELRFLEESLRASLGTKVSIKHRGRKGRIEIEYYSLDDLDRLVAALRGRKESRGP